MSVTSSMMMGMFMFMSMVLVAMTVVIFVILVDVKVVVAVAMSVAMIMVVAVVVVMSRDLKHMSNHKARATPPQGHKHEDTKDDEAGDVDDARGLMGRSV